MKEKFKQFLAAKGFTEEQIKNIVDGMPAQGIYLSAEDNIDERYGKLKLQKEKAGEDLKTANTTITELKKKHLDVEALQTKIGEYEKQMKDDKVAYDNKIKNLAIDSAISLLLKDAGVKYPELLMSKFDRDTLKVDKDGVVDKSSLEAQFNPMKETYKELISPGPAITGKTPSQNGSSTPGANPGNVDYQKIINDPTVPLAQRIAAKNQLFSQERGE